MKRERKRLIDTESKLIVAKRKGSAGMGENKGNERYKLPAMK